VLQDLGYLTRIGLGLAVLLVLPVTPALQTVKLEAVVAGRVVHMDWSGVVSLHLYCSDEKQTWVLPQREAPRRTSPAAWYLNEAVLVPLVAVELCSLV